MDVGFRFGLLAQFGMRVPTAIEQHQHWPDVMLFADIQKHIDALDKPIAILLSEQVMQIHTCRVHPDVRAQRSSLSMVFRST
jgi:hypothetical protein